jgi:hypothetical protein
VWVTEGKVITEDEWVLLIKTLGIIKGIEDLLKLELYAWFSRFSSCQTVLDAL